VITVSFADVSCIRYRFLPSMIPSPADCPAG